MGQVISGMTPALEADPSRLSLAMRAWARLALLWPPIQARFAEDWRQASSVAAKGYATPRFLGVSALWVPVDWVLEKNRDEEDAYLEMLGAEDSKLGQTHYIQEIQIRKHGRDLDSALARAEGFRQLAASIKRHGIRRPVFLADVSAYDLPYRMYRFNGHHRAICAKHLGMRRVPALVFKVTPPQSL